MADTEFLDKFVMACRLEGSYRDNVDLDSPLISPRVTAEVKFSDGTGADQIQLYFQEKLTITDGSPFKDYDFADGTMKDPFGRTLVFSNIKGILLIPAVANLSDVVFGGAAADKWESWTLVTGSKFSVPPGSPWQMINRSAAGWAVGGANDRLRLANPTVSSDDVIVDVHIVGEGVAT